MKHKLLIFIACVFNILCINAQDFTINGINYTITDATNLEVAIGEGSCYTGDLVLNATVSNNGTEYSVISTKNIAFGYCKGLTSIDLPDSLTSIGSWAFDGCTSLTSIDLPDTLTSIGESAFRNCSSLTSIDFPDTLTRIGDGAFQECSSLTSIDLPDTLTSIGDYAFDSCTSLTSIDFPDTLTRIGDGAFWKCTSLTSIDLPKTLTSIGDAAFVMCTNLTSIDLPDTLTSIGDGAFQECSSLTSIDFPDSLTSIGESAFYYCTSLTSVVSNNETPLSIDSTVFMNVTLSEVSLSVPVGSKAAYEAAPVWKDFGTTIEHAIAGLETNFFEKGFGLKVSNSNLEITNKYRFDIENIQILNLVGGLLKSTTKTTIDISNLPKGVYIVYIQTNTGTLSKKFIKK